MNAPTSRENPNRPLSTADLAAASRQSQRMGQATETEQDDIELDALEQDEIERDELAAAADRPTVSQPADRQSAPQRPMSQQPPPSLNTSSPDSSDWGAASAQSASSSKRAKSSGSPGPVASPGSGHSTSPSPQSEARAAKPASPAAAGTARASGDLHQESLEPLFASGQAEGYRNRWIAIQSSFVDDPRAAVQAGDELVAQVMSELANSFADQRHRFEAQLDGSGTGNTEHLRVALRSYRSFFERLLSL